MAVVQYGVPTEGGGSTTTTTPTTIPATVPTNTSPTVCSQGYKSDGKGGCVLDDGGFPEGAGGTGTPGSTSTTSINVNTGNSGYYAYLADLAKIKSDQEAGVAALGRTTKGAQYQSNYLTGLLNTGVPSNISDLISGAETGGQKYIGDQYTLLANQLKGAYDPATNIGTGFLGGEGRTIAAQNALRSYLAANPSTAFRDAPRDTPGVLQNDLAAYMQAQGVDPRGGDPGRLAATAALQGGSESYNRLLDFLTTQERATDTSRSAEEQMARSTALSNLSNLYQGQSGGLQQEQLKALSDLQSNIASQRLTAEQGATTRNQSVQDALAALFGTGYINPADITPTTITGAVPNTTITTQDPIIQQPAVAPTAVAPTAAAPGYSLVKGKPVANLGKAAPGYDKPTVAELAKKPATGTAPAGTHWEWNGAKWVAVLNKK